MSPEEMMLLVESILIESTITKQIIKLIAYEAISKNNLQHSLEFMDMLSVGIDHFSLTNWTIPKVTPVIKKDACTNTTISEIIDTTLKETIDTTTNKLNRPFTNLRFKEIPNFATPLETVIHNKLENDDSSILDDNINCASSSKESCDLVSKASCDYVNTIDAGIYSKDSLQANNIWKFVEDVEASSALLFDNNLLHLNNLSKEAFIAAQAAYGILCFDFHLSHGNFITYRDFIMYTNQPFNDDKLETIRLIGAKIPVSATFCLITFFLDNPSVDLPQNLRLYGAPHDTIFSRHTTPAILANNDFFSQFVTITNDISRHPLKFQNHENSFSQESALLEGVEAFKMAIELSHFDDTDVLLNHIAEYHGQISRSPNHQWFIQFNPHLMFKRDTISFLTDNKLTHLIEECRAFEFYYKKNHYISGVPFLVL
jgi:hypothetical protein